MRPAGYTNTFELLLVDDSREDVELLSIFLKRLSTPSNLSVAEDGVEALAFLRQEGPHANARRPDLVLLDLNMPKKHGFEVLEEMRSDGDLKRIPVCILTTSERAEDIDRAYDLTANTFFTKQYDIDDTEKMVKSIEEYWFKRARLPDRDSG